MFGISPMAAFQAAGDCWRLPQAIGWGPMAWAEEARAFGAQIPPRQERRHAGIFGRVLNLLAFSRQKFMRHLDPRMRLRQDPKAAENAALQALRDLAMRSRAREAPRVRGIPALWARYLPQMWSELVRQDSTP